MNILITGIHGFVGNNLVESLNKRHTIYGLDIISPQKAGLLKTFNWYELDKIPSVDIIIHLAGIAHDTKNQTNAQIYFDINAGLIHFALLVFRSLKKMYGHWKCSQS